MPAIRAGLAVTDRVILEVDDSDLLRQKQTRYRPANIMFPVVAPAESTPRIGRSQANGSLGASLIRRSTDEIYPLLWRREGLLPLWVDPLAANSSPLQVRSQSRCCTIPLKYPRVKERRRRI
jgi:hypothetical protein